MSRRMKVIGAILTFLAVLFISSWPLWKWVSTWPVPASVFARTKEAVEKNPQLQPAWDQAMEDGVLTWGEAKAILEKDGEGGDREQ